MLKNLLTISATLAIVILSVGFMFFGNAEIACAQSSSICAPLDATNKGWAKNSTVYYDVSALPAGKIRDKAVEALNKWNTANASNGSGVNFQPSTAANPATFTFAVGGAGGAPAQNTLTSTGGPNGGTVINASVEINLSHSSFDPRRFNYSDAILGTFLHEIGHSMGLEDMPIPSSTTDCGGQTANQSVMNGICGVNDIGGNLPSDVKDCDNNSVRNNPKYANPTPTPTPTPGGGECRTSSTDGCGEPCPCNNCETGCDPPDPTCDWYYPPMECNEVCVLDEYGYPEDCEMECYQPPPVWVCY